MIETFIIMLREGVEAALVVGITLVILRNAGRDDLRRAVGWGVAAAVAASVACALLLESLPISGETFEGALYLASAAMVGSMMVWMHRKARTLKADLERRVQSGLATSGRGSAREAWLVGGLAFFAVLREGAETVLFLVPVSMTTDAVLGSIGAALGLAAAVTFGVMFVRGSVQVNLRRFFVVTEWVLVIFVAQMLVNGYHELSEAGYLPATKTTMATIGPIVRNNTLFILAIVAIPLFVWLSGAKRSAAQTAQAEGPELRLALAKSRRDAFYRRGALVGTLTVLLAVGVAYAAEHMPKEVPSPTMLPAEGDFVRVPTASVDDGGLHRFGLAIGGRVVRFLVVKTNDGKLRTTLDACEICGPSGYVQEGAQLICLNCGAEINPQTLGLSGGCNPIPLESSVVDSDVRLRVDALRAKADVFPAASEAPAAEVACTVCGMKVALDDATLRESYGGNTYYFCGMEQCLPRFRKDPGSFAR